MSAIIQVPRYEHRHMTMHVYDIYGSIYIMNEYYHTTHEKPRLKKITK